MKSQTAATKKTTTTVESARQVRKSNTGRAPRYKFKFINIIFNITDSMSKPTSWVSEEENPLKTKTKFFWESMVLKIEQKPDSIWEKELSMSTKSKTDSE